MVIHLNQNIFINIFKFYVNLNFYLKVFWKLTLHKFVFFLYYWLAYET